MSDRFDEDDAVLRSLPDDALDQSSAPQTSGAPAAENNPAWLLNKSRAQQLLEARSLGEDAAARRVTLSMSLVVHLFGPDPPLPIDVLIDCPGEKMSEVAQLRKKSQTQALLFFREPLLSKIKSYSHHHRKWTRGEDSMQKNGSVIPCIHLDLGIKKEGSRSMFMGVFLNQGRWQSQIRSNGKLVFLGHFKSEVEAAQVYDSAMTFKKGDKAKLNFPNEQPRPLSEVLKARMLLDTRGKEDKASALKQEAEEKCGPEEIQRLEGEMQKGRLEGVQSLGGEQDLPNAAVANQNLQKVVSNGENGNGTRIMMKLVLELFGPTVSLPLRVLVECAGEEKQLVWLKKKSAKFAAFHFPEPLESKIKVSHPHHRKWTVREEEGAEAPILCIELGVSKDGKGKFLGVSKDRGKYVAKLCIQGRSIHVGSFTLAADAARAYDVAARYVKGDKARLNYPDEEPESPSEEMKVKLAASKGLQLPQKRKATKRMLDEEDEEEIELENEEGEEEGEPWEEEEEDKGENVEEEEEDDQYYLRLKRRRGAVAVEETAPPPTPAEFQGVQTNDEEHAALALMSFLQ